MFSSSPHSSTSTSKVILLRVAGSEEIVGGSWTGRVRGYMAGDGRAFKQNSGSGKSEGGARTAFSSQKGKDNGLALQ
jgi:hypothetical protein